VVENGIDVREGGELSGFYKNELGTGIAQGSLMALAAYLE